MMVTGIVFVAEITIANTVVVVVVVVAVVVTVFVIIDVCITNVNLSLLLLPFKLYDPYYRCGASAHEY